MTISAHSKLKKELLSLEREELVLLVTVLLDGESSDIYDLLAMLGNAAKREPAVKVSSFARTEAMIGRLHTRGFLVGTIGKIAVAARWHTALFFAADALRRSELEALVYAVNRANSWPEDGSQGNSWHVRYADIRLRLLQKILLDKPREFRTLYAHLTNPRRYYEDAQITNRRRIEELLAIVDHRFWSRRDRYLYWLHFTVQQTNYPQWTPETPRRLERTLTDLHGTTDTGEYSEDSRVTVLLGMHHYRTRRELLAFDPGLQGVADLLNGEAEAAREAFGRLTVDERVGTIVDVIAVAFAYGRGELTAGELDARCRHFRESAYPLSINAFLAYNAFVQGQAEAGETLLNKQLLAKPTHALDWMVILWCFNWTGVRPRLQRLEKLLDQIANDHFASVPYVRAELANSLLLLFPQHESADEWRKLRSAYLELAGDGAQVQGGGLLQTLLPVREPWEYALRLLDRVVAKTDPAGEEPTEAEFRTIWILDFENEEAVCKEQKRGKRGWSKGRALKWYELIQPKNPRTMDPADTRAVAAISTYDGRRLSPTLVYSNDSLFVDFGHLLHAIADHPRVYIDDKKRIPVELTRAEPELIVSDSPAGLEVRLDPPVEEAGYVWRRQTPTRYRVYHLTEQQGEIGRALSSGVTVPQSERTRLEGMVEELRPTVAVQSTFDLIDSDLEQLTGTPRPCVHLLPYGEGYQIVLYAKPLADEPLYFQPGAGLPRSVVVTENGRKVLLRDLPEELAAAEAVLAACPTLRGRDGSHYEYVVDDTQTALRILLELRRLVTDDEITIEHPKGEQLKITATVGSNDLAIRVGKNRDWFEVDGKLTVNEDRVLQLESLFDHLRQRADSPFVELADGEFLALTDELRDRILEMEGLLHQRAGQLRLPTLAAGAFAELADDLEEVTFDDEWRAALDRIERADKLRPRVPKNFNAELRDYQKDGFRWLMRLAEWGVGGCLADDMGLGKTVQALAMLTARGDRGPALVIAPASVTRNWQRETERFAPALIPVLIAAGTDAAHLAELGPGDLALVSYGLLPFIAEEVKAVEWATIVLDEAQAIKNAATKRAKIVQDLNGEFKLATTGTPIENHLGELWSLFRFLNPGLLGSKAVFNEKFNRPIARMGDEERRATLKSLVKPFILRRRKDEVLTELPPKTEIILRVDLSEEEKALYEALRRQALKDIAAADEQQKRFTVLAQLTKLRQAACHPRLVRPTSKIPSAKLELVGETLLDILDNGHKALIFSQFVKHLKIVENWVKGQGVFYQYLDGSTPGKAREQAVNAFQAGEGQVFLISLKAGGTGLNLTEADYVLHLDPWWNPAAEDQASDRAHRIGQQRPVTVYRFVSEGTVEEQIISLHQEKRDLADQILSGTGKAGKLEVGEILDLLRQ